MKRLIPFIMLLSLLYSHNNAFAQFSDNPFSIAVDNTLNNFISVGPRQFFVQSNIVNAGNSALQSGNIGNNQSTDLRVLVRGGDQVQFDYRTSTEANFDSLVLVVADLNGIVLDTPFFYSGEINWRTQQAYTIPGNRTQRILLWVYQKDGSLSFGDDAVWVDNIQIKRDGVAVTASELDSSAELPAIIQLLLDDDS